MEYLTQVTGIVMHCSDTEDGPGDDLGAIRRFHTEVNGWQDVGYHFLVEQLGGRVVLRPGRPTQWKGAHCKAGGQNHVTLGLCVVGRFDDEEPSPWLRARVADALAMLCFFFTLTPEAITFHRTWESNKTCPGMKWDLREVCDAVTQRLRGDSEAGRRLELEQLRIL